MTATPSPKAEAVAGYMRDRSALVKKWLELFPETMRNNDGNVVGVIAYASDTEADLLAERIRWIDERVHELTSDFYPPKPLP